PRRDPPQAVARRARVVSPAVLRFLTAHEHAVLAVVADRLIPPLDAHPGGAALGAADYVDRLLGAFTFDPPLIFAGGPFSGRAGGEASFGRFLPLSRHEELAWRTRIEGSLGRPVAGSRSTATESPHTATTSPRSTAKRRIDACARSASCARFSTSMRAKARTDRPSTAATPGSRA